MTDFTTPSGWRFSAALQSLQITLEDFDIEANPDADGYSHHRSLAIHPDPKLWPVPIIALHELSHIVLGHTAFVAQIEDMELPKEIIPKAQFELEAHQMTKALAHALKLADDQFPRDNIQRYIDSCKSPGVRLESADAIRLAQAVLTIVDAGEISEEAMA